MIDFEALVSGVMQPLERFVKFRVGNLSDAEDILQEVLTAAYRGAETLSDEVMFKPWILGIARTNATTISAQRQSAWRSRWNRLTRRR